jgi:hypothetical protein
MHGTNRHLFPPLLANSQGGKAGQPHATGDSVTGPFAQGGEILLADRPRDSENATMPETARSSVWLGLLANV